MARGSPDSDLFGSRRLPLYQKMLSAKRERAGATQTETFRLAMLSGCRRHDGASRASNDLLTMFAALEASPPQAYGFGLESPPAVAEAAMKYLPAFFLYGVALPYGATGTLTLPGWDALAARHRRLQWLTASRCSRSAYSIFKVGAVPFTLIPMCTRAHPPRSPGSWRNSHQGRGVRCAGGLCVALPSRRTVAPALWAIAILP